MKVNEKLTQNLREQIGDLSDLNTEDKSSLVGAINDLLPVVLFETDKTFSNVADNTVITLNDDITKYKRIVIYAMNNNRILNAAAVYNPSVGDVFSVLVTSSGSRSGYYAFESATRNFTITASNKITYGEATTLTSKVVSQNNLQGFVLDGTYIKIYAIVGFKY